MFLYSKNEDILPRNNYHLSNNEKCALNNINNIHNINIGGDSKVKENRKVFNVIKIIKSKLLRCKEKDGVKNENENDFHKYVEDKKDQKEFKRSDEIKNVRTNEKKDGTTSCIKYIQKEDKVGENGDNGRDRWNSGNSGNSGNGDVYVFNRNMHIEIVNKEKWCNMKGKPSLNNKTVSFKNEEMKTTLKDKEVEINKVNNEDWIREGDRKREQEQEIENIQGEEVTEKKENSGTTNMHLLVNRGNSDLFRRLKTEIVEMGKKRQEEENVQNKKKEKEDEEKKKGPRKNQSKLLKRDQKKNGSVVKEKESVSDNKKPNVETNRRCRLFNSCTDSAYQIKKQKNIKYREGEEKPEKCFHEETLSHSLLNRTFENNTGSVLVPLTCKNIKESEQNKMDDGEKKQILHDGKPGKRTIRVECLENSLFNESFFRKMFENLNDFKKYHFLRDKSSYLKLFETSNKGETRNAVLQKVMAKTDMNEIKVFDENTYKTIFVVMKKLNISTNELYYVLSNMKEHSIFKEELDLVEDLLPKEKYIEELKSLKQKKNWEEIEPNLRNIEKQLLPLCDISRVKHRMRIIKFHYTIDDVKKRLLDLLELYNNGCYAIQNSTLLFQLFQAILTWVNYVNTGDDDTYKIKSINLFSLNSLQSFKTTGFRHNALQYIVVNMLSFDVFSNIDEIIELRKMLWDLQKLKGSEIIEEIHNIETEIIHIKEELENFQNEYKDVLVTLVKILDKGNIIFSKLTKCVQQTKHNILSLACFYGVEDVLINKDVVKFPSAECLFKPLYMFIDNVYNILNDICLHPVRVSSLLIDENRKFGHFNNTQFYKNVIAARHRGITW